MKFVFLYGIEMLNIYISDSNQDKIDDFTLLVSCIKPEPTHKIAFSNCNDDNILNIIESRINNYCDKSVVAIINNDITYNIIDYDYNRDVMRLRTTHHYYKMMDKIQDAIHYQPNTNINLFVHMF